MSGEKKLRVSSKQRLDLIKASLKAFYDSGKTPEDYARFLDDAEEALTDKLDPAAK